MKNIESKSYKETRDAYVFLLEKILDASVRLGLEITPRQQSALSMLLEGSTYRDIARFFDIERSDAVGVAKGALNEIGSFLDNIEGRLNGAAILATPIHRLPFTLMSQSVLLKAGYYTLGDVAKEDKRVLAKLPDMTPEMMKSITSIIRLGM